MGGGLMGGRDDLDLDLPGDDDDFDDLPATHLDDEAYEDFLRRELDDEGRPRGRPPVGWIIALLAVLVLAIAVVMLQR